MENLIFSGDVVIYLLGLAVTWGTMMWRLSALEKKVGIHNNFEQRIIHCEDIGHRNEARIKELESLHPRESRNNEQL